MIIALVTGIAGARACATLVPRAVPPRYASFITGAAGGAIAAALAATVVAAARAVPLPPTATSGGVDLAAMLGIAASGALGGIVLSLFAGAMLRFTRAR